MEVTLDDSTHLAPADPVEFWAVFYICFCAQFIFNGISCLAIQLCASSLTLTPCHLVLADFPEATLSTQVPGHKIHIWDWQLELLIPISMTILISIRVVLLTGSSVSPRPRRIQTPELTPRARHNPGSWKLSSRVPLGCLLLQTWLLISGAWRSPFPALELTCGFSCYGYFWSRREDFCDNLQKFKGPLQL